MEDSSGEGESVAVDCGVEIPHGCEGEDRGLKLRLDRKARKGNGRVPRFAGEGGFAVGALDLLSRRAAFGNPRAARVSRTSASSRSHSCVWSESNIGSEKGEKM